MHRVKSLKTARRVILARTRLALDLQLPSAPPPPSTRELKMGDQIQRLKDDPKEQQKKEQAEDKDQREISEQPVDEDDSGPSQ